MEWARFDVPTETFARGDGGMGWNLLTAGNESRVQCSKAGGGGGPYGYDDDVAACASDLKSWRGNTIHGDVYDDHATATVMSGRTRSVQCEGNRGGNNKTNGSRSHSKARGAEWCMEAESKA